MFNLPQKISLILLALLYLFLMQYFQHNTGGAATDLPYNLTSNLGVILFVSWGLLFFSSSESLKISNFNKGLFFALCLISIPIIYPQTEIDFIVGHYLFNLWLCWLGLLVLDQIKLNRQWRNKYLVLFIMSAVLQSLATVCQYYSLFPFDYLPLYSRPVGIFGQTNLLVSYLSAALGAVFYLLIKSKNAHLPFYQSLFFGISIALFSIIIIYSGSRTGLISLLIILTISSWAIINYPTRHQKQFLLIAWLSLGLSFTTLLNTQPDSTEFLTYKATSAGQRANIYPPSIELLTENFVAGIGYGNFEKAIFEHTLNNYEQESSNVVIHSLQHPHNEFLYLAIQGGIVAIFGMLLIIYQGYRALGNQLTPALLKLLPITPFAIHSMVELPLVASFPHLFSLLLLLYLATPRKYNLTLKNKIGKLIFKPTATVFLLSGGVFYISGLHTIHLTYQYRIANKDAAVYQSIVNPYIQRNIYLNSIYAQQLVHQPISNKSSTNKIIKFYLLLIEKQPRPQYFNNLCLAYYKMSKRKEAREIILEMQRSFPSNKMYKRCEELLEKKADG